jgi:hypothetical protein
MGGGGCGVGFRRGGRRLRSEGTPVVPSRLGPVDDGRLARRERGRPGALGDFLALLSAPLFPSCAALCRSLRLTGPLHPSLPPSPALPPRPCRSSPCLARSCVLLAATLGPGILAPWCRPVVISTSGREALLKRCGRLSPPPPPPLFPTLVFVLVSIL